MSLTEHEREEVQSLLTQAIASHSIDRVHLLLWRIAGALSIVLPQEEIAPMSYEESQRRGLCPYCGRQGHVVHTVDAVLLAYVCEQEHRFYVERRFLGKTESGESHA